MYSCIYLPPPQAVFRTGVVMITGEAVLEWVVMVVFVWAGGVISPSDEILSTYG